MSGGGGGGSGKVEYPDYMMEWHHVWLENVAGSMQEAWNANPYEWAQAFNPSPILDYSNAAVVSTSNTVSALVPDYEWSDAHDLVSAKVEGIPFVNAQLSLSAFNVLLNTLDMSTDWNKAMSVAKLKVEDEDYDRVIEELENYRDIVAEFIAGDFWSNAADVAKTKVDGVVSDADTAKDALAYAQTLEDEIKNRVIPRFRSGLRDVNAVMNSAFVLGESVIWGMMDRDVAKYFAQARDRNASQKNEMVMKGVEQMTQLESAKLMHQGEVVKDSLLLYGKKLELTSANAGDMLKMLNQKIQFAKDEAALRNQLYSAHDDFASRGSSDILQAQMQRIGFIKDILHYTIENNRIGMVALKEYTAEQLAVEDNQASWDLKTYQYGANMLAAIGGGAAVNSPNEASTARTAIGGALSGAGAGAAMSGGNPVAIGIGAILGAGLSLIK